MYTATLSRRTTLSCCSGPKEASDNARRIGDCQLVRRVQAGDEAAFRELIESHQSKIFGVIYRLLRNRADAEDITQEVFAKVYLHIPSFDCRGTLFGWIYRIAVNECYGWRRKRRTRLVFESDSSGESSASGLSSAPDCRPTAEREFAQREFVSKLLARMTADDRALLLCKEVEGLSMHELAEMTGLNENTLKVRLFRVRRRCAELAVRLSGICEHRMF